MRDGRAETKRRFGIPFRIVCIVGTAAALWWFVRGLDFDALGDTFERATLWPLVLAVLLNFGSHFVRALGWFIMLGPRHRVPLGRLLSYELAAQAASSISPARAGEALRFWLLKQEAVPVATTAPLIVLEKLFGAVGLTILVAAVPWLLPGLPAWVASSIVLFAAIMLALLASASVAARRATADRLPKILSGLVGGMHFLRDSRRMLAALAAALAGEAVDVAAAVTVLYALHIELPIAAAILILFMTDVSNLLPAAPAQVGTFEVGVFSALDLLHVQHDAAFAFALLFHAQQVLPQIVVGLPFEVRFFLGRRRGGAGAELSAGRGQQERGQQDRGQREGVGRSQFDTADGMS